MVSNHQIAVELVAQKTLAENQLTPPSGPGDYTINIRAADGWNITGQYRNNILQTILIDKSTQSKSEA